MFKKLCVASLISGFILILSSCTVVPRKKAPVSAPISAKTQFDKINNGLNSKNLRASVKKLQSLIKEHPNSDIVDDSWLLIGDIYFKLRNYKGAFEAYMSVSQSEFFSPQEADSLLRACKSLYKLGAFDEALALSKKALNVAKQDYEMTQEIHRFRYVLQSQMGDNLDALQSLVYLSKEAKDPSKKRGYEERAIDYLNSRLNQNK